MAWTVVNFLADNSVEAVPVHWLCPDNNTECYWPSYNGSRLTQALKNAEQPSEDWGRCSIRLFNKNCSYHDYKTARRKAELAEDTSDLASETDGERKRKSYHKKYDSESSDSDDMTLPPPPSLKQTSSLVHKPITKKVKTMPPKILTKMSPKAATTVSSSKITRKVTSPTVEVERSSNASATFRETLHVSENVDCFLEDVNPTVINYSTPSRKFGNNAVSKTATCSCCAVHNCADNNGLLQQVVRKQTILQGMLSQLINDIQDLKKDSHQPQITLGDDNFFNKFNFPINAEENLLEIEEFLQDSNNFKNAVSDISGVEGHTAYEFTKRILKRILTDRFASNYSWLGVRTKKSFKSLKISDLLISAAKLNAGTKTTSEKDIEESIKKFIVRAKERADQLEKKKSK